MEITIRRIKKNLYSKAIFLAVFLLAFHFYLVSYINSNFLATYVGEDLVGVFYIISGVINIFLFLSLSQILKKAGNYKSLIIFTTLEIFALLGLSFINEIGLVAILMLMHLVSAPIILFNLDIFVESSIKDESKTGTIRGNLLSTSSLALIMAPLLAGNLASNNDYSQVYLTSSILLIPFLAIIALRFRKFIDPKYHSVTFKSFLKKINEINKNKNTRSIFASRFLLEIFWVWMTIYIPIYLHLYVQLSWPVVGTILTIALLPYIILEPLLGKIADTKLGEKEILITGFFILIISTAIIPFVNSTSPLIWIGVLLLTRIGASGVEITTETYFFKHVDGKDAETISFFRMHRPLGYVAGVTIAVIALSFISVKFIFLVLASILAIGIKYAFVIKDTR